MSLRVSNSLRLLSRIRTSRNPTHPYIVLKHPAYHLQSLTSSFHSTASFNVTTARISKTFYDAQFTTSDIPPLSFWKRVATLPLIQDPEITPERCHSVIQEYVNIAVTNAVNWRSKTFASSKGSRGTNSKGNTQLDPYLLHYTAIMLLGNRGTHSMALHIMQTLTITLAYRPSVMTLVRLALQHKRLGNPLFAQAEAAFQRLVRQRDDPNACALQAMLLGARDSPVQDRAALEWLRLAMQLGGEEKGAWEWQAAGAVLMGCIYLRLGDRVKALDMFRYCAEMLDVAEGCLQYGLLLEEGSEERKKWVLKAAVSGSEDAVAEMARIERRRLEEKGQGMGSWERKASRVMAEEWEAIAQKRS